MDRLNIFKHSETSQCYLYMQHFVTVRAAIRIIPLYINYQLPACAARLVARHYRKWVAIAFRMNSKRTIRLEFTYINVIESVTEEIDRRIQFDNFEFIFAIFQSNGPIEFIKITDFQCAHKMLHTENGTRV